MVKLGHLGRFTDQRIMISLKAALCLIQTWDTRDASKPRGPSCSMNSNKSKHSSHICWFLNVWTLTENRSMPLLGAGHGRPNFALDLSRAAQSSAELEDLKAGRGAQGHCDCLVSKWSSHPWGQDHEFQKLNTAVDDKLKDTSQLDSKWAITVSLCMPLPWHLVLGFYHFM